MGLTSRIEGYKRLQLALLFWMKRLVYQGKMWDICVPNSLENSLMMFDSQNYERLFPREQRLFSRPFWPYSLHTFSLVSLVKKYATCKAKIALKKAFVHEETDVHSFESQTSLTNFLMHVEHICLRFSILIRVYYDLSFLTVAFYNTTFKSALS